MKSGKKSWKIEYGLSKVSICEATGECAEIIQYELLESLLEAVYLIRLKDEEISYPKRRFRKLDGRKSVIELLIAALDPELIFEVIHPLSTSSTEGCYRDLMIILPDKNHRPFKDLEPVIELITAGKDNLYCSLHKFSGLYQSLEEGHFYFSLVCIPQNVMYQRAVTNIPKVSTEKMSQIIDTSKQEFEKGLEKANKFYQGARYYQEINERPLSMFMLHQATELTFRTIAISLYGSEKRTHSIRSLKRFNHRLAPQLNDLFPDNTPESERLLKLLEESYLNVRYASHYEIDHTDLNTILIQVSSAIASAETIFAQRIDMIMNGINPKCQ